MKSIAPKMTAGQTFNGLTTIEVSRRRKCGIVVWLCRCECGNTTESGTQELRAGIKKSCGCWPKNSQHRRRTHAATIVSLGTVGRMENGYNIWTGVKQRCFTKSCRSYPNYGGRGITMAGHWRYGDGERTGYECFMADMGPRPSLQHSIDRINPDGNYEPGNCRWADAESQQNNKRGVRKITAFGKTMSGAKWSREFGVKATCIMSRIDMGWDAETAVSQPARKLKSHAA